MCDAPIVLVVFIIIRHTVLLAQAGLTTRLQMPMNKAFLSGDADAGAFCVCVCVCMCQQVVVDTAQIENKEAYAPQITLDGSKVVVQVPSTW